MGTVQAIALRRRFRRFRLPALFIGTLSATMVARAIGALLGSTVDRAITLWSTVATLGFLVCALVLLPFWWVTRETIGSVSGRK
jgi:putative Ca2+/H+ antiporter (TMEM165/GDT1 family)